MSTGLRKRPTLDQGAITQRLVDANDWVQQANQPDSGVAVVKQPIIQKSREPKGEGAAPWSGANDRVVTVYNLRLKESLRLKLKFLSENEPNSSMHSIAIEAVEKEVAARLRKYEKASNPKRAR